MIYPALLKLWGHVFGRPSCRRLNNLLVNLGARGLGVGDANQRSNGEERNLTRWLAAIHAGEDVGAVVDVGANEGDFAATVVGFRPDLCVHAFEPHPQTFARLRARVEARGVRCHNLALGSADGVMKLWDYTDRPDGTSHATFHPDLVRRVESASLQSCVVRVATLAQVAPAEGIGRILLLKLDTEGHELECLRGARGLLAADRIDVVQFEFNFMHLDSRVTMQDFAETLAGFDLYRILPHGIMALDLGDPMSSNLYRVQNIIACRRGSPTAQLYVESNRAAR